MQPLANESALIAQAKQGDKAAVSALYEAYAPAVFRYIAYRVDTDQIAEDLTAEVFLRMVQGLPRYLDTGAPFGAWLFRIAATQVVNHYRQRGKGTLTELSENQPTDDTDPLNTLARQEEKAALREALQGLPADYQTLLVMRFMQQRPHEEVAAVLGKSEAAIRVMQHRALKALAKALGAEGKARSYLRGQGWGMNNFSPEELDLIERLQNAPQPNLRPSAFDAIWDRMLAYLDAPVPLDPPVDPVPTPAPAAPVVALPTLIGVVVATVVVTFAVTVLVIGGITPVTPTAVPTAEITATLTPEVTVPGMVTAEATELSTVEITPEPSASPTVTAEPTAAATSAPTAEATIVPTVTASATALATTTALPTAAATELVEATVEGTLPPNVVIEGPIQAINGNVITVYNINITLNVNDPVLPTLTVGEVVRIDGTYTVEGSVVVVVNVTVTTVVFETLVNPQTGEVWEDNGTCSNPPPPWAPAVGWRERCEGGGRPGGGSGNGNANGNANGRGNGRGGGDDDDDD